MKQLHSLNETTTLTQIAWLGKAQFKQLKKISCGSSINSLMEKEKESPYPIIHISSHTLYINTEPSRINWKNTFNPLSP